MGNKAYQEGYNARCNGSSYDENPYPPYTDDNYNWSNGWNYADRRLNYRRN